MSIKLLSKTEKEKVCKKLYKIELDNGNIEDLYDQVTKTFKTPLKTMPKGWEPFYDYTSPYGQDECGDFAEFEDCCGASILCSFGWRTAKHKFTEEDRLKLLWNLNYLFSESKYFQPITVAILNKYQQKHLAPIFKKFGGYLHTEAPNGHHGYPLYTWIFTKGNPKKRNKVFV